jgi:hypothetical protein
VNDQEDHREHKQQVYQTARHVKCQPRNDPNDQENEKQGQENKAHRDDLRSQITAVITTLPE